MDLLINKDLKKCLEVPRFLKQCMENKEIPPGNILQIQQVSNISVPTSDDKNNYDSESHVLKITVTDGLSQGYALVYEKCAGINSNIPPGTKIKTVQAIPVRGGIFALTKSNCEVLGGKVDNLIEQWEFLKKKNAKSEWGYDGITVEETPPQWKRFGYKAEIDKSAVRKMKTTDVIDTQNVNGKVEMAEKSQFDLQRDEAISELQAKAGANKQFHKPNKHLIDKEIKDIMEKGFSQSETEYAMNRFKNPQRALKFLKDSKGFSTGQNQKPSVDRKDARKKGKCNSFDFDEEGPEVPREFKAPVTKTSLFSFFEGRFPDDKSKPAVVQDRQYPSHSGRGHPDLESGMRNLNIQQDAGGNCSQYDVNREDSKTDFSSVRGSGNRAGYNRGRGRGRGGRGTRFGGHRGGRGGHK